MYFRMFDCWRFIAALLVMTYHFLYWAPGGAEAQIAMLYRLLPLLDMFFMISGFFITSRYATRLNTLSDFKSFFRRRFARLYPLHFITLMFFTVAAFYAWSVDADNYPYMTDFENLPYHLLGIHALGVTDTLALNYVSWSVSAEFFSYAMFPLIVIAIRWRGTGGLAFLVLAYLAVLELASHRGVFPSGHWTTADTHGAYRAFADFMIGGLIARIVAAEFIALKSPLPGLFFMALAVTGMLMMVPWYVSFLLLIVSLYLSAVSEIHNPASTRRLAFAMPVTAAAFGIYIWHPVFEFIFLRVLWDRLLVDAGLINFYLFMLVPMTVSILVAVVSCHFLEPRVAKYIIGPRPAGKPGRVAAPTA